MLRKLLGHMIVLFFKFFSGNSIMFSIVAYQFKSYQHCAISVPFLHIPPKLCLLSFDNVQSNIVALILSPDDQVMQNIFHKFLLAVCISSFYKNVYSFPSHVLIKLWWFLLLVLLSDFGTVADSSSVVGQGFSDLHLTHTYTQSTCVGTDRWV